MEKIRRRNWIVARPALLLALAAFGPLAIYAIFNGYLALDRRQAVLDEQAVANARTLAEAVDREIAMGLDDAQTLAEAPALDTDGNSPLFRTVAERIRRRHPDWRAVAMLRPDGRWLFSTEAGAAPPDMIAQDLPSLRQAVRTQRPVIGNMVNGPGAHWGIPIRAPVVRGGRVLAVVTIVLKPEMFAARLANLRLPAPWIGGVVNSYGRVVARWPNDEAVVGLPINAEARRARAGRPQGGGGTYHGHALDGSQVQSAFWISPVTGWSAQVAMPLTIYEAPIRQLLATLAAGFTVCLLLAVALVILWIRDQDSRRGQAAAVEQATRIDALGRLTGGVAHDFNNLLTVIQGNAEILARRLPAEAQAERPLAAIRMAADRAAKLTRQLLVFARGGPAEATAVDLGQKIDELTAAMSQLMGGGVVIDVKIAPGTPPVRVDPLQLEAALLNLAANARDAMQGSGALHLKVDHAPPWVVLSVRDEGPGFDPGVLARVFDPFFTTKPVGQGTGLGLSQVYGLVKGVGGQVEAANAPGGGGVVTLMFPPLDGAPPILQPPSQPAAAAAAAASAPMQQAGLATVLLVDDNDEVRSTAADFLRECGLTVIEASDAAHALKSLESARVEAVASDIIMPGEMDGIALAETIHVRWPQVPVLLVSGYSARAAEAQARGLPVVNKPYSLPDLERRLRVLMTRAAPGQ